MSNSEKAYKINIKLNKPMIGAKLTLINGSFQKIDSTLSDGLNAQVPGGLYQVRIDAPGYYQEEYIKVASDNSFIIDVKSISAFPVPPYKSTHEPHQKSARQYSEQCTLKGGAGELPNFLFFFAFYDLAIKQSPLPFGDFAIFNDTMTHVLRNENTFFDEKNGAAVFSAKLPAGLYFILYSPTKKKNSDNHKKDRIIPAYIFEGKQTQFFIRCAAEMEEEEQDEVKVWRPDFSNCRIFYSDRIEFDYNDSVYATMERLLMAYSNYSYYKLLTEEDNSRIANSSYLVALAHILHLALDAKLPFANEQPLDLPDLQYLRSEPEDKATAVALSEKPPILSFVMYKYSSNKGNYVTAASWMDRMAEHVKYDLYWSSCTRIESRNSVAEEIRKVISDSSMLGKTMYFLENLIPFAVKPNVDDVRKQLDNYTGVHGDEHEIAKKLNIPYTTVIRKYDAYKEIYNSTLKKEKDIENDNFFKPGT